MYRPRRYTEDDILIIAELFTRYNYSVNDLLETFPVHRNTLYNILNGSVTFAKAVLEKHGYQVPLANYYKRKFKAEIIVEKLHGDRSGRLVKMVAPSGEEFITNNVAQFCKEFGLDPPATSKLLHGQAKSHLGWTGEYQ